MNGYERNSTISAAGRSLREIAPISDLSPAEINAMIHRGRVFRAAWIAEEAKRIMRAWLSVIPRRRHLLPRGFSRWQTLPH